jgi:hypothetical protein
MWIKSWTHLKFVRFCEISVRVSRVIRQSRPAKCSQKYFHQSSKINKDERRRDRPCSAVARPRLPYGDNDLQVLPPIWGTRLFHSQTEKSSYNRTRSTETFLPPRHRPQKTINLLISLSTTPSWVNLPVAIHIYTFGNAFRVSDDIQAKRLIPDSDLKSTEGPRLQNCWHRHHLAIGFRIILRAGIVVFGLKHSADSRVKIVAVGDVYTDLVIADNWGYE